MTAVAAYRFSHLEALEAESIFVIREVVAEFQRPVLLFSGGKDSIVMLRLAEKAFWPAPIPFPVMHVDTGHNFDEVLAFRDERVNQLGLNLIVASVPEALVSGLVREPADGTRNRIQTPVLLEAVEKHRFDALFGGARRDEEKARAKERVFGFPRRVRPVGPPQPAPRAVVALQRPDPRRRSRSGCSRCPTGPSSTCGTTSPGRASPCRRSTSPTSARWSTGTGCSTPYMSICRSGRARSRSGSGPLPHRRRRELYGRRAVGRRHGREGHRGGGGHPDHRARRHPGRRPGQRGGHGGPEERRLLLDG